MHGDGQYAPEALPRLLASLVDGHADAVFGSRTLVPGDARRGGMPLYKYVGNRILSEFENFVLGMSLSEFHSGFPVYSCASLKKIPFEKNSDDFHFDTQIIIQMHAAGMKIVEEPIPTHYGDEICYVNGVRYAKDVIKSVIDYRFHELGLRSRPEYAVEQRCNMKGSSLSSQNRIATLIGTRPRRILDVGCGRGDLGKTLSRMGHYMVGVDTRAPEFMPAEFDVDHVSFGCVSIPARI